MRHLSAIACFFLVAAPPALAGSTYDGSWRLVFTTQTGTCDASYYFVVDISNGIVTHPNLLKLRGRVATSGNVRASVKRPEIVAPLRLLAVAEQPNRSARFS